MLRRLHPDDLAAFQAYRTDPAVGRWQGWTAQSDAQALAFLTEMAAIPLLVTTVPAPPSSLARVSASMSRLGLALRL